MTIIETRYGKVAGVECENYIVYRGIPYAKPPVGELRWKAPVEPDNFEDTYIADKFSAICPQNKHDPDGPHMGFNYGKEFYSDSNYEREMSEDCLYLNIWTPSNASKNDKLPVAFYIHGGAFMGGYSSEQEFDGKAYAEQGVILVTIGYRLGIFGFLAHPLLSQESPNGVSGNYGILDQIAALKWVYENIENFGGDPENITVFGQSAGCMSSQVLVSSELTGNMISKAILQSGVSCEDDFLYTPTLEDEMTFGERFVKVAGASTMKELRAIPTAKLMEYQNQFVDECFKSGDGLVLVPCVDGYLLNDTVRNIYQKGEMKKIPYIAGFVEDDLGRTDADREANRAGVIEDECKKWALKASEVSGKPAYVYSFAHHMPGDDCEAFHSAELWYMFGTYGRCWRPMTDADVKLSEEMVRYWSTFMKTGHPIIEDSVWEPYVEQAKYIKVFA